VIEQPLSSSAVHELHDALRRADYTVAAVSELLGDAAHAALARHETTPAMRRTVDGSPLATLVRLWPLQQAVSTDRLEAVLPGLLGPLTTAGLLEPSGADVRARLDIRPYADEQHDWWVVSDLTPGLDGAPRRMAADHVLGVSGASASLAQLTVRAQVERALDLGTGSGVQALHLAQHSSRVVATDVNPRCLLLADLTARLNRVDVDLRSGSLWQPVAAEQFDLIVTNPPFVISPGTDERLVYRDSGLPGDELMRQVVTGSAAHLSPGGRCQVLGNWLHGDGESWTERLEGWVAGTGCDAWVVERERIDVSRYVELWLDDAGLRDSPDYTARYDGWLAWFEQHGVTAIGLGWIALRRAGRATPYVQIESWPYDVDQPLGPHVEAWGDAVDLVHSASDEDLLARRLRVAPDVVEERVGPPGDLDPDRIVLRSQRGMRRAHPATTAVAGMVGACDGDLSLGQIVAALAEIMAEPRECLSAELVAAARRLLVDGLLLPGR
jgi:methylase of polypeptide subunit release factors